MRGIEIEIGKARIMKRERKKERVIRSIEGQRNG